MFKIGKGNQLIWLFLGLIFLLVCVIIIKYTVEGFAPSQCTFIKLGDYNLSADNTVKLGVSSYGTKKGLIYIPAASTSFSSLQYQKTGDLNYSYISMTKTDINDVNVFARIKSIMACHGVPEFSNTLGVNSKAALLLCLQSNSGTISRTFFIKCFAPSLNSTTDDSNVIVGEIDGNTTSSAYSGTAKAVALIQNSVGVPNIMPTVPVTSTDYSYSLSYTICPAASRPQGFLYSDCCSGVSDSVRIIPTSWSDLVLTDSTKCPGTTTSTSTTTPTTPTNTPATKSKGCGSNPDDASCPMPYCSLDRNKGSCSGDELSRDTTTGKYLDPTCKVGNFSAFGGRAQTICTGTSNLNEDTSDLDIYKLLRDRSQYHRFLEDDDSGSGDSGGSGGSGSSGGSGGTGKNWLNNSWFSGGKFQNNWNGDTSNIPKNSYTSNKDELTRKNELLEQRLARLEGQMILNNPSEDQCDEACLS
jgi:hypothetical protein